MGLGVGGKKVTSLFKRQCYPIGYFVYLGHATLFCGIVCVFWLRRASSLERTVQQTQSKHSNGVATYYTYSELTQMSTSFTSKFSVPASSSVANLANVTSSLNLSEGAERVKLEKVA